MRFLLLLLLPASLVSATMNPDGYIGGWTLGADLSLSPSQKSRAVTLGEYRNGSITDLSVDESKFTHSDYGLSLFAKLPTSETFSLAVGVDVLGSLASAQGKGTYTPYSGSQVSSETQTNYDTIINYAIHVGVRYYFLP